jgi:XTP/dITP diphosphohydrolase
MQQFLLATRNPHKTRELAEILGSAFAVYDLTDAPELPVVAETGLTFEANATLKAVGISKQVQGLVVADDSGLEVDALNGAPGVFSARYAGDNATDAENVAQLLAALAKCGPVPRSARFRCCLVLAERGEVVGIFEGAVEGLITQVPRGSGGFGYDSVFQPQGQERTLAELSPAEKNRISHRAQAAQLFRQTLLTPPP